MFENFWLCLFFILMLKTYNPFFFSIFLVLFALLVSFFLYSFLMKMLFSYLFCMVYIGGILVLFLYLTSFISKNKLFLISSLDFILLFILSYLSDNNMSISLSYFSDLHIFSQFYMLTVFFFLCIYLFIIMFLIFKKKIPFRIL